MSTQERDPIFESLDRLATMADADVVGDRMPDIERRVRVGRRRKSAGIAVGVTVLALGGIGVWQSLPGEDTTPPVANNGAPWQDINVVAHRQAAGQLAISFTVSGESTAYVDATTGEPSDYAGPETIKVIVDGTNVSHTDKSSDISCGPGDALTPYTLNFHADEPLVVPVTPAVEHTIVVKAPYCADGEIVENTKTVTLSTGGDDFTTADRYTVDLDNDGEDEVVRVSVPTDVNAKDQLVEVMWGTGETTSAPIPNTMTWGLLEPRDYDNDGDLEVIALGGGGEYAEYRVFQVDPNATKQVKTVDASGKELPLVSSGGDPTVWQIYFGSDGIYSYRLIDPNAPQPAAPVDVRTWSLSGNTLTQSADSFTWCVTFDPMSLGPC